jgi:2-polyprenyl-3-methyl-5-hydroxy-6-metoxy-1,4-benzoquinol methylase
VSAFHIRQVTACPGCACVRGEKTGREGAEFSVVVGNHDYTQPAYSIIDCPECGLLYKDAVLADDALDAYYADVDFRKWEITGLFPTERIVAAQLRSLPPGASILDVGCSSGRLLSALPSHYNLFGVEPNAAAAGMATSKGITIIARDDALHGPFDAIVMMDVFEHLTEPTSVIQSLTKRLKPGGKLIITTGDGGTPLCRESPAEFWYFRNVEHVCMISRRYAGWLTMQCPIRLVSWVSTSHYDSTLISRLAKGLRVVAWRHHRRQSLWWKYFFNYLPMLGRARHWTNCPAYDLGKDHVVATFQIVPD